MRIGTETKPKVRYPFQTGVDICEILLFKSSWAGVLPYLLRLPSEPA
jgi:hypothetical protein